MILKVEKLLTEQLLDTKLQKIFHHKITVTLSLLYCLCNSQRGRLRGSQTLQWRCSSTGMSNLWLSLWITQRPQSRDQDKHSHWEPVQLELTHVMWVQMKWPTQCVLNVSHLHWMAITPTSPRVNSEIVGPIGYLVAMMWHGGHLFSLETGCNLHFFNIHQQRAIKQKLYITKNDAKQNKHGMLKKVK